MANQLTIQQDFNQLACLQLTLPNLASAPSSPVEGEEYYNTVSKIAYFYNGTSWVAMSGGGGGGTPGGSDTQVQFNDAGSFGGDAGFTYNKTTDSITVAGNQTFSGSAKRIKGDFSNATRSNRVSFQTSTTDSNTLIQAIPSGTGTLSGFLAYGDSDPDNSSYLQIHAEDSVHVGLNAGKSGTGTTQDLVFQINGTTKVKVNAADGKLNVDTLTASELVATDASKNLQTLPVASYPSLAELAYVKGVTSAIQTQINTKQNAVSTVTVSGTTQAIAVNTNYIATNASQTVFTLPAAAAVGDKFSVIGVGAAGWKINQNASQSIRFGASITTTGVGGSAASTATTGQYDSAEIICTTENTDFRIINAVASNLVFV